MPVDLFNPLSSFPLQNQLLQPPQARASGSVAQPLSPDEQQSLLERIGASSLHGLGWIGGTLSKSFGGRAIRGALGMLAGHDTPASELLSFIPGSDTFGLTDPANEMHGSHLLGGDKDTPFLSPEGIGGLGLDLITDPAMYLTFGGAATNALGKAAGKLGTIPKTAAGRIAGFGAASPEAASLASATGKTVGEVAGQALGGHVGLGIPFTDIGTTFDLTGLGSTLSKIPGVTAGMEKAGDLLSPLYRGAKSMFQKSARGQVEPVLQDLAIQGSELTKDKLYHASGPMADLLTAAQEATGWSHGKDFTPFEPILKQQIPTLQRAIELTPKDWSAVDPARAALMQQELAALPSWATDAAKQYRSITDPVLDQGINLGLWDRPLAGGPEYMRRQQSLIAGGGKAGRGTVGITPTAQQGREDMFKGLFTEGDGPAGNSINNLARDTALRGMNPADAQLHVLSQYLRFPQQEYANLKQLLATNPAGMTSTQAARLTELEGMFKQATDLVGWQKGTNEKAIKELGGYFVNHPLRDLEDYIAMNAGRHVNAAQAYKGLAQMGQAGGEVPLASMLPQLNLKVAAKAKDNLIAAIMEKNPGMNAVDAEALMGTLGITPQQAERMKKFVELGKAPEGAGPWLGLFDSTMNLTKAGQTAWPSTQVRNIISDFFTRWGYGGSVSPLMQSGRLATEGQTIPGLAQRIPRFAGMTDEAATKQLLKEGYQLGLGDIRKFQAPEASGIDPALQFANRSMPKVGVPEPELLKTLYGHIPGEEDLNLLSGESRLAPWNVRGVAGKAESKFAPVAAMQSAQSKFEAYNKWETYIDASARGFEPQAAMNEVIKAHHDFGNLSDFEKNVMRRIVPFYSWMRQNVPQIGSEIATNPGGRIANSLRTVVAAGGPQQGLLPHSVSDTGEAIPLGSDETGRNHYLTSLGLPFEDLTQLTSLNSMLGSTAPYIRLPWELATGRQVFNNRDIPATYPLPVGGPIANSLVMNSPLSRVFSQGNVLMDPNRSLLEKAAQMLAGQRVTTIDPQVAQRTALREEAERKLQGLPATHQFNRTYIPADQIPTLSPQELEMYRLLLTTQRR